MTPRLTKNVATPLQSRITGLRLRIHADVIISRCSCLMRKAKVSCETLRNCDCVAPSFHPPPAFNQQDLRPVAITETALCEIKTADLGRNEGHNVAAAGETLVAQPVITWLAKPVTLPPDDSLVVA